MSVSDYEVFQNLWENEVAELWVANMFSGCEDISPFGRNLV